MRQLILVRWSEALDPTRRIFEGAPMRNVRSMPG